ncbi:hypothetical protein G7K71_08285 [Desulfofundulus sp. TPOSR]|uniref:hypothetical protein n=1 Tax=Desulfofundulus sp. TPOSR TaxID=2714340 RepID=UPI00140E5279|nr:hypothetical protein [Desulfofundulus sp. TPOSR]NHM26981.1 hypothetical protein [Desulfofundulus sp. TPOSR]
MILSRVGRDQKGFASVTFLVLLLAIMAVGSLLADVAQLYAVKIAARHYLNLSLRAAAGQLSLDDLKNNRIVIDEPAARDRFYEVLRANFKLDGTNQPLPGSLVDGPVEVCYFRVVNSDMLPFSYTFGSYSETITRPAVTGIIRFPVKVSFWGRIISSGVPDSTDMYVHSTVAPELIAEHL